MLYVDFGRTGLKVSQLALGTGMLGARKDRSIDKEEARLVLENYVSAGGNLIDVSDAYQGGQSEEMIGSFMAPHREDVVLASKFSRSTRRDASAGRVGNHRKGMMQSVEGSLKRLQTDRIDLYFAHYDDGVTPMDEIMRGFDDLVSAGKVLYTGLSNFPAWRTAQAGTLAMLRGWAPLASIEVEYSLLQRTTEREILPLAKDTGLGVLGYSPLAAGVLTARKREGEAGEPSRIGIPPEADTNLVLDTLIATASELEAEAGNVALAWVCAKGVFPILGVRNASQLAANLQAGNVELTPEQVSRLDQASAIPLGYPQALLALQRR